MNQLAEQECRTGRYLPHGPGLRTERIWLEFMAYILQLDILENTKTIASYGNICVRKKLETTLICLVTFLISQFNVCCLTFLYRAPRKRHLW